MKRNFPLLITALIISVACIVQAQEIEYVGSILWTGVNDVQVAGNYAYCACSAGLGVTSSCQSR